MEFNKIRYLKLLKQNEGLKKRLSLYIEDQDRYLKLLKCKVRLADQICWKNKRLSFRYG